MKTIAQLKKVQKNTLKMGNKSYKEYKENGGIENLNGAIQSYRVALLSIKYQLLYKYRKNGK